MARAKVVQKNRDWRRGMLVGCVFRPRLVRSCHILRLPAGSTAYSAGVSEGSEP